MSEKLLLSDKLEDKRDFKVYLNVSFGAYCGLLLGEKAGAKLATLQKQYMREVKTLLAENLDDVRVSHWTLDYSSGKRVSIKYHNEDENNEEEKLKRIEVIDKEQLFKVSKVTNVFKFKGCMDYKNYITPTLDPIDSIISEDVL